MEQKVGYVVAGEQDWLYYTRDDAVRGFVATREENGQVVPGYVDILTCTYYLQDGEVAGLKPVGKPHVRMLTNHVHGDIHG